MYILDLINDELVSSRIVPMELGRVPLKKDGWHFKWKDLAQEGQSFLLTTRHTPDSVEGALCLTIRSRMLFMEALELAPYNVGREHKRYDYVAGCLIAYACRMSLQIEGEYEGFLVFTSKTELIHWYVEKYGAKVALGQRLYFDPNSGRHLINEYLSWKNKY